MTDIPIDAMLKDFGIANNDQRQIARAALAKAGVISRPHRANIAAFKSDAARAALLSAFLWHCANGDCRRTAQEQAAASERLLVEQPSCAICGGSPSARVLRQVCAALAAAGRRHILILGGTESKEREILGKSSPAITWRFIDGKKARDDRYYRSHRKWADIIIIWQSTPLDHRVSAHFDAKGDARVITVRRRGIAALAAELIRHLHDA